MCGKHPISMLICLEGGSKISSVLTLRYDHVAACGVLRHKVDQLSIYTRIQERFIGAIQA